MPSAIRSWVETCQTYLRRDRLLAVLIAAHIPFLIAYLSGLWQQTHYQFFPFAIGAFVWLFATRRSDTTIESTIGTKGPINWCTECLGCAAVQY